MATDWVDATATGSNTSGNCGRFWQPLARDDGDGGIDFQYARVSDTDPIKVTVYCPIAVSSGQNDPT